MSEAQWNPNVDSYLEGRWQRGTDDGAFDLVNPATGAVVATGSTAGLDLSGVLAHARDVGGPALRAMTFAERGAMLAELAQALHAERERFLAVAQANGGNTRKDAKFDVDGAIGTVQFYANLGKKLGDKRWLNDGDAIQLGRSGRWMGQHILVPRHGAAIHINAFNFPAWGTFEKAAVALLAGMPVVTKPAPATALLAVEMARVVLGSAILPSGSFQILAGEPGDLLDHVGPQDVVAFTGSSQTGTIVRRLRAIAERGVAVNVEADSVNAAVLAGDVGVGSETWHLFLGDVMRDVIQKAGQKCTAVRRLVVASSRIDDVEAELRDRFAAIRVGDPTAADVDMGPVTNRRQAAHVREGIAAFLAAGARRVYPEADGPPALVGDVDPACYVAPTLLRVDDAELAIVHEREVFGPVATLLPFDGSAAAAAAIVVRGEGGLVCSVYSDDVDFAREVTLDVAPYHGRVYIGDEKCAAQTMGPGTVLPTMVHGGPGRAGCGEELGGERGLSFYMQRVGLQGSRKLVGRIF